ncbi:class I SAM-dependent methyltransferase [Peribacillus sp. SCS-155]|uniref:class I SAM-dependent methyltransferase n=1 Tax=Peribacillus sedimenti TaxID=3115297 RepID=UPI003906C4E2
MIGEYARLLNARNWMKKNIPFLYSWHAYVGYELDLFQKFSEPATVSDVARDTSYEKDLLEQWVDVGVAVNHLKKLSNGRYKTAKKFRIPASKRNPRSTGIILKEMMELHIPTLLAYPELMRNNSKRTFNHEMHGQTVAQTSSLLEQLAYPTFQKLLKKYNYHTVLDLGCGQAGYISRLAEQFTDVDFEGIELNGEVAASAKERCAAQKNIMIRQADLMEFEPQKTYDVIMMNNLLHYIRPDHRTEVMKRVSGWLSEDGRIAIMTPISHDENGAQFSSAFNSFFSAFNNLYPVPSIRRMKLIAKNAGLIIDQKKAVIKEGGWYVIVLKKR